MAYDIDYQRRWNGREERSADCIVCHKTFNTYYQHKKTCSSMCSDILRETNKRRGQEERCNRWRSKPENIEKMNEGTRKRYAEKYRGNPETIEKRKKYRIENIEKINAIVREWYKKDPTKKRALNHKRRVAAMGIKSDHREIEKRLRLFDACVYCGSQHGNTVEHLVPVSKGGTNATWNLYVACKRCNSSKGARQFLEWYRRQTFYDYKREFNILSRTLAG